MDQESQARIERIKDTVKIEDLLFRYGYDIRPDSGGREQQFCCDLHGDGNDLKPSARVYPDSGHFYCFGCGKQRDVIELTREKEGLPFWQAIRHLEKMYNLPQVEWVPREDEGDVFLREQEQVLRNNKTYEQTLKRLDAFLEMLAHDRILPWQRLVSLFEARDKVHFMASLKKDPISEKDAKKALGKILLAAQTDLEDLNAE